jgi:hypothetical protein
VIDGYSATHPSHNMRHDLLDRLYSIISHPLPFYPSAVSNNDSTVLDVSFSTMVSIYSLRPRYTVEGCFGYCRLDSCQSCVTSSLDLLLDSALISAPGDSHSIYSGLRCFPTRRCEAFPPDTPPGPPKGLLLVSGRSLERGSNAKAPCTQHFAGKAPGGPDSRPLNVEVHQTVR